MANNFMLSYYIHGNCGTSGTKSFPDVATMKKFAEENKLVGTAYEIDWNPVGIVHDLKPLFDVGR